MPTVAELTRETGERVQVKALPPPYEKNRALALYRWREWIDAHPGYPEALADPHDWARAHILGPACLHTPFRGDLIIWKRGMVTVAYRPTEEIDQPWGPPGSWAWREWIDDAANREPLPPDAYFLPLLYPQLQHLSVALRLYTEGYDPQHERLRQLLRAPESAPEITDDDRRPRCLVEKAVRALLFGTGMLPAARRGLTKALRAYYETRREGDGLYEAEEAYCEARAILLETASRLTTKHGADWGEQHLVVEAAGDLLNLAEHYRTLANHEAPWPAEADFGLDPVAAANRAKSVAGLIRYQAGETSEAGSPGTPWLQYGSCVYPEGKRPHWQLRLTQAVETDPFRAIRSREVERATDLLLLCKKHPWLEETLRVLGRLDSARDWAKQAAGELGCSEGLVRRRKRIIAEIAEKFTRAEHQTDRSSGISLNEGSRPRQPGPPLDCGRWCGPDMGYGLSFCLGNGLETMLDRGTIMQPTTIRGKVRAALARRHLSLVNLAQKSKLTLSAVSRYVAGADETGAYTAGKQRLYLAMHELLGPEGPELVNAILDHYYGGDDHADIAGGANGRGEDDGGGERGLGEGRAGGPGADRCGAGSLLDTHRAGAQGPPQG